MKTKEELDSEKLELLKKYKPLYTIEAPLSDVDDEMPEVATIFLKKPDRTTYAAVTKLASGADPLRAVEFALKACYVGGDELKTVIENDDALMSCEGAIVSMLKKKEAVLKKN